MNEEIVQYILINSDLKMSRGKQIAQACHVVGMICNDFGYESKEDIHLVKNKKEVSDFLKWFHGSMTKITLKAPQKYLEYLISLNDERIYHIRDEGRNQIEPNSLTAIALIPMPKNEAQQFVSGLKLL